MDAVTSLSVYRETIICSIWALDSFPDDLREFVDRERRYLQGVVESVEADIQFYRRSEHDVREREWARLDRVPKAEKPDVTGD